MITIPRRPAAAPTRRPASTGSGGARPPWIGATAAGLAVLLAGAPVQAVVRGNGWVGYAAIAVAVVVLTGLLLHRRGVPLIAAGQVTAVLVLLTTLFTDVGGLGVLPGPRAVGRLGELINGAGRQIRADIAPVDATPEILVLTTASFGLLAVAVHLAAVSARAPAAAGVPLLAVFAIPTALADGPLPITAMVAAAAGYGLLLIADDARPPVGRSAIGRSAIGRWAIGRSAIGRWAIGRSALRRLPAAVALVTAAILLAVGLGSGAGFVGTAGRFSGGGVGGSGTGSIGLSPFTALRGQLTDAAPVELLRVRGLPRATYLRALTLNQYVSNTGWRATTPAPGMPLPGPVQLPPGTPGDVVDLQLENRALYDYWLPLYGVPLSVDGLPAARWAYDQRSGTGYAVLPRQDGNWQERALLPRPTAAELRAVTAATGSAPGFDSLAGVDPRVIVLARRVTAGRDNNFDRAMALQDYFTGRDSLFRYSLQTAPGTGDDALVDFLTVGRAGYCEQFASAMAVMLRAVGIPSRVAVGFTGGTDLGDFRSIRSSDAHAWVEAYFPGTGWVVFDPTPLTDGRTITPEYVLEARGQLGPDGTVSAPADAGPGRLEQERPAPQPVPAGPQPAPDPAVATANGGVGWLPWALLAVALLAGVGLTPAALRARQRARRLAVVAAGGPAAADAAWREVLADSTDRGVRSPPSDTVRGAARRTVREHRLGPDAQHAVRELVGAVESSWYGGRHPGPAELTGTVAAVLAGIAAGSPTSLRDRLLPRSLRTTRPLRERWAARWEHRAAPEPVVIPNSTTAATRS